MSMYINTNIASLNVQRMLNTVTKKLDASYQVMSSGNRINSAKDDAAGLQISNRMMTQISGLNQGNRNALDGISMLQVAEGALEGITDSLQRIRTLAIQSANGTNSEAERAALQDEVSQLSKEINRTATDTTFGGQKLLDGEQAFLYSKWSSEPFKTLKPISQQHPQDPTVSCRDENHTPKKFEFQVGADAYQTIDINIGIYTDKVYCNAGCQKTFPTNAYLSFDLNGLYFTSGNPNTKETRVVDIDEPAEEHVTGFCIGDDGLLSLDVSTQEAAQNVLKYVDGYIATIDGVRAEMGAKENRLEAAILNQENIVENVSAAKSRIKDTDYAAATATLASDSILQQAATSILAQANSLPQIALTLLNQ